MSGIVVVDQRGDWPVDIPGVDVVTAWDYLTQDSFTRLRGVRVYNLCRTFSYQTTGYYVSLLDRKSTRLNSSHLARSRMPSSA